MAGYLSHTLQREGRTHSHDNSLFFKVFLRTTDKKTGRKKWEYKGITVAISARAAATWAKWCYKTDGPIGIAPAYVKGPMKTYTFKSENGPPPKQAA